MTAICSILLRLLMGSRYATVVALALFAGAVLASGASVAGQSGTDNETAARSQQHRTVRPRAGRAELHRLIDRAADQHGVEVALVHAVVAAESAYETHAVSPAGAVGLMQLMPATALDYGVGSRAALFDPATNIDTGVRHLKRLLRKYRGDYGRVIMAYNAGEGVVDRTGSNLRFPETLDYTEAVLRQYRQLGGRQPTEHLLRRISVLKRHLKSEPPPSESSPQPDPVALLPRTSARLQARLPRSPLDDRFSSVGARPQGRIAGGRPGSVPGSGLRPGIDPAVRDTARPASSRRAISPVVR